MNREIEKVKGKLIKEYVAKLTKEKINELMKCEEVADYVQISSGKRLVIDYVSFSGVKSNGDIIDYQDTFSCGINIIIADNFKGKSTIFKVIKTALVGDDDYIKPDVSKWINKIVVGFSINKKKYTIVMNRDKKFDGKLFSCEYKEVLLGTWLESNIVFEATNKKRYEQEIQQFFFNEFNYFSLRWTQKKSQKGSLDLLNVGTSWKTYFKSIYLESKDSNSFYGSQEQKTFQQLLGLENTQIINALTVKKELLEAELGKRKFKIEDTNDLDKVNELDKEIDDINIQLKEIREIDDYKEIKDLQNEKCKILSQYNQHNKVLAEYCTQYQETLKNRSTLEEQYEKYSNEYEKCRRSIVKNKRLLIDVKEYLESERFFSSLDIKFCPSCNHEIQHVHTKDNNSCPLCHTHVVEHNDNRQLYEEKIFRLEKLIIQLENEKIDLDKKVNDVNNQRQKYSAKLNELKSLIANSENSTYTDKLSNIDKVINELNFKLSTSINNERDLIERKALLEYMKTQRQTKENDKEDIQELEDSIDFLQRAVDELDKIRFEKGKGIIKELTTNMLDIINDFGLTSITDIQIDNRFNIIFTQNDTHVKFDRISEGEQLRVKLAFYLSLIKLDIDKNYGKHTRFLIIDSPSKEEGDSLYLEGLKEVLLDIQNNYKGNIQILVGTAIRDFEGIANTEKGYEKGEYIF